MPWWTCGKLCPKGWSKCSPGAREAGSEASLLLGLPLALLLCCRALRSVITVRALRTHRTWKEPCRDAVRNGHGLCEEDRGPKLRHTRTTMTRAFSSTGAENTMEMNMPLESKYWYFENNLFQERFKDHGTSQHGVLVILSVSGAPPHTRTRCGQSPACTRWRPQSLYEATLLTPWGTIPRPSRGIAAPMQAQAEPLERGTQRGGARLPPASLSVAAQDTNFTSLTQQHSHHPGATVNRAQRGVVRMHVLIRSGRDKVGGRVVRGGRGWAPDPMTGV